MAKTKRRKLDKGKQGEYYSEPNHDYFSEHFEEVDKCGKELTETTSLFKNHRNKGIPFRHLK
ncbi:MAG: hypothetical protein HY730_01160 [Candidatus Tectomicrobia bacterium]|uniref:Uncharacterized protein n=1 Tax=Tectimicrobiota bacterium TaxID=2528274 RepID=A0A933GKS8_UNCTE|nr:hypothetical protein [Candidatus Tectomicrobia bacterium]